MRHIAKLFLFLFGATTVHASHLNDDKVYRYHNARVVKDHKLEPGELWVLNGKIIAPGLKADHVEDMHGQILAPGYIDVQLNGGWGVDFSSNPNDWKKVAKELPKHGVTAFLATLVTLEKEKYPNFIRALRPTTGKGNYAPKGHANLLGVHLEGPFLNHKMHGAHNEDLVVQETPFLKKEEQREAQNDVKESPYDSLEKFYGTLRGVRMITHAPEIIALDFKACWDSLREKGIVMAAGHTNADYPMMRSAQNRGVRMTTHLYNAMTPFHHRNPGIIAAVLEKPEFNLWVNYYSIIADSHHVHPAAIRIAYSANPKGLILVTDAMQALGLEPGDYKLGSMDVTVQHGRATITGTETLAGSVLSMERAVQNFLEFTEDHRINYKVSPIVRAIEAATLKPAILLGVTPQRGTLNVGSCADFIVLDNALRVQRTYIGNYLAYDKAKKVL